MSIGPRESAVAAALTGAVVVVLGYASGFGLRTPVVHAAQLRPPVTSATTPATAVPAAVPAPVPAPVQAAPVAQQTPATAAPVHQYASPAPEDSAAEPTPEPTPPPTAPTPTCGTGLLDDVLAPVDTVVATLLDGGLLADLVGADRTDGGSRSLLTCAVGSLTGSTCCPTAALRTSPGAPR